MHRSNRAWADCSPSGTREAAPVNPRAPACRVPVVCLLAAVAVATAGAAPSSTRLDPARSHADFEVGVLFFFRGRGNFGGIEGEVSVDDEGQATVVARISIDSLDMRRADQERWAKGPEFFDAARWPQISFRSDPVPLATLGGGGRLPGMLTIRGVERRYEFDLAEAECEDPGYGCPVRASGWVRRSHFGLGEGRRSLSDRVRLRFAIMLSGEPRT